jgi:hypothetical protein
VKHRNGCACAKSDPHFPCPGIAHEAPMMKDA